MCREHTYPTARPGVAVVATPHHRPPAGRLAGRRAHLSPLGSAAGEKNLLGRGFITLVGAPWWVLAGAAMTLVTATLFTIPVSLRLAADITIGASALALVLSWGLDPATTDITGTPLWGCLLFSVGIALIDAGYNLQERRARPPRSENGA